MTSVLDQPPLGDRAFAALRPVRRGTVERVLGLSVRVRGVSAAVGDVVRVDPDAGPGTPLEVVAVDRAGVTCVPLGATTGLRPGQLVAATGRSLQVPTGEALLGRVLDGLGRPVDGGAPLDDCVWVDVDLPAPAPLSRQRIDRQMGLGVRAIDTLVPAGRGQRLGIMAGSGVGKSTVLSMMARGTDADVCVLALVGERGREVREFIERDLGPDGLARSVVVAATSDASAPERRRAAFVATRIAEAFRDEGRDVVLMVDSLTRVAMAQREIGLAAGEPPATRGYPPSVFGLLPGLLERAGASDRGTITGLYTVLIEGDDLQDPIGDAARSILDGHIVLSRELATAGHFPSIDVLESISRVAPAITSPEQRADAARLRSWLAAHRRVRELVEIGAYVTGSDPDADAAIARMPSIEAYLRQDVEETVPLDEAWARLREVIDS
ncbi:FliI/YscN family ATPase [Aeromicrobium phragmitis]|uniref:FliI/YscN family ATPase n=1 Tax=Aeromicrobium phragmitis TaxID=2478914 RepID=A0A3L8PNU6_9ACTN|nr:FliI/YscN family ATPase [Aeromicrobium phragmitis]RLV56469.1 FliI/YscN family ATPase [Aeromicrobium phragmitis]